MKRSFSAAAALITATASLVACDPPIGDTETVRNQLTTGTGTNTVGVGITSIELRFRGEQDGDITPTTSENFVNIGGPFMAPAVETALVEVNATGAMTPDCTDDDACEDAVCRGGRCVQAVVNSITPTETGISQFACGNYDVRVTGTNGQTCEIIANADGTDATGQACTTVADCPAGFSCVESACAYNYQGDNFYICFVTQVWDLDEHLSASNCAEIYN